MIMSFENSLLSWEAIVQNASSLELLQQKQTDFYKQAPKPMQK